MNSTAVNISAQLSVSVPVFNSLVYIQSGIAGSYGNSLFDFFEKLLGFCFVILFFHSGCTIVHSYQQYTGVYIFPHLCQNFFLFLFFLMIAILMSAKWYLIVVLICISQASMVTQW